jgi:hypothetical protein
VVKVNSGQLVHYTIEETIRTWQIAEQTTTIDDDGARWIYAKCNKTNYDDAFIIFQTKKSKLMMMHSIIILLLVYYTLFLKM